MAPLSQELEPPPNPVRFNLITRLETVLQVLKSEGKATWEVREGMLRFGSDTLTPMDITYPTEEDIKRVLTTILDAEQVINSYNELVK